MKLSELLPPERIRIPLESGSKEDVLRELVSLLPSSYDSVARDQILQAVLDRESRMSTGIGQGVAIPHGKSDAVQEVQMTFGLSEPPLEYDALDGEPVEIFFLLVSPPDLTGPHIKLLAQISRMLSSDSVREELVAARDAETVVEVFRREEEAAGDD